MLLQGYLFNTNGSYGYGTKTLTAPYTTHSSSYSMPTLVSPVTGTAYYTLTFQNP